MKIVGVHPLADPFIGHGTLSINGQSTDNIRGRPVHMIVDHLNTFSSGVVASINEDSCLVLESPTDFTISGHQDVLSTFGLEST